MVNKKMIVLGYARVSTDNQLENYSIDEQVERINAYCKAKDWILRKIYIDGGYSGGNIDRPALQQMLDIIKKDEIDAIVVYKLDRLSRSQKDTLMLIEDKFLSNKTDFVSISENFDTSTPFGRAMIGILSVFAQLEKDQITERFTMGRIARSKAGYFHGGGNAVTGYDYIDGKLVINEYEALQVKEVFNLFLQGKSINAIEKYLKGKYKTKWSAAKVLNILKNSVYIGKVHFKGEEYNGIHESIIDKKTFETANSLLISRKDTMQTYLKTPFRAGYLLSSLVFCERCGARYAVHHGFYKCYSRAKSSPKFIKDPNCKNDNWPIKELEEGVCAQIDALIKNPSLMKKIILDKEKQVPKKSIIDSVKHQIENIDKKIDKLIDLYQIGSIPIENISKKTDELLLQKKILQQKIDEEQPEKEYITFNDALEKYRKEFQNASLETKRILIASIIEKITINGQSVKIYWRI